MRTQVPSLTLALLIAPCLAASDRPFQTLDGGAALARSEAPAIRATAWKAFRFDPTLFSEEIRGIARERADEALTPSTLLELPHPDGGFEAFRILESEIMEPGLAEELRGVRTFRGVGLDDPTATVRLDVSPRGFSAMVLSARGAWYVEPWSPAEPGLVVAFHRRDALRNPDSPFVCNGVVKASGRDLPAFRTVVSEPADIPAPLATIGPTLLTYRLALATTGEYSAALCSGNLTKPCVAATLVSAMNRVNGIYERELGIRMTLVASNNDLIFLNAETDGYTNGNGLLLLGENQAKVDAVIGSANYDIGHVFSTGGGGVAVYQAACWTGYKAQGVTGSPLPTGDAFWVDYVAHEMGHQFGGSHTFDATVGSCGGGNRVDLLAYEPGSGSTIMAYAGICGSANLQPNSDPYFHVASFDEILSYVSDTRPDYGGFCPARSATGNSPPSVEAGPGYSIPARTPFALTGSASDPNGDALTYSWEQLDLDAGTGSGGAPLLDNGTRPIFRSFDATTSPTRAFPRLSDVLSGTTTYGETLPTTNRTLTFRLTARDNRAGGGGLNYDTTTLSVTDTGSAFAVTAPSTAVTWAGNSSQTVTWNPAGTTAVPISCANVSITFSSDGGTTFPTTVLASTPNDGTQSVTIPNVATSNARLKVACVGNVFFAVSRPSFTVTLSAPLVPALSPIASPIVVGGAMVLSGTGFTAGSVVKFYVATATGVDSHGPFTPTGWTPTALTWEVPATIPLGNGFGTVQVVNTDQGFTESNPEGQLLYGDAADNIPTITAVNGVPLNAANPSTPVANVSTLVLPETTVTLTGTGLSDALVNLFTATGNVGPLTPLAGATPTQIQVVVPAGTPTGPGSFQAVNAPYTGNVQSNAVSVPIGALVTISGVSVNGTTVTVDGTGFCSLTVINLFNDLGGGNVVNLGGLNGDGSPKVPLTIVGSTQLTFQKPAGAVAGAAYVQALNPPFIPYSSSGDDPDGAFTMP